MVDSTKKGQQPTIQEFVSIDNTFMTPTKPLLASTRPQTSSAVVQQKEIESSPPQISKQLTIAKKFTGGMTSTVIVNNGVSVIVNSSSPPKPYEAF